MSTKFKKGQRDEILRSNLLYLITPQALCSKLLDSHINKDQ